MLIATETALNTLFEKGVLEKIPNNAYIYKTDYGYLEKKLQSGEVFVDTPTIMRTVNKVEDYSRYAIDLLKYKECIQEIEKELKKYDDDTTYLKQNSSLTPQQVNQIVKEYKLFLKGERSWKHTDEASKYGVSVSTIKRCLISQKIYEKDKHKRKNNLPK